MTTAERLAAILVGAAEGVPDGEVDEALLAEARRHDVVPLLYRALRPSRVWSTLSDQVRSSLRQAAAEAVLANEVRTAADRELVSAFTAAGIPTLIFKGAALCHTHYPEPWLRARVDTDVLIRPADRDRAAAACERLGCVRALRPTGEYATHQFTYVTSRAGLRIDYDIHWKIADPHAFARVLAFDELLSESVPLRALGSGARAIGDVHAWLVGCLHRVAHHFDRDWLLFLYDVDRLVRRFDEHAWSRAIALAHDRQVAAVCARSLALTAGRFGTPVPAGVADALAAKVDEPSAVYLRRGLRRFDILQSDLRALDGWRARARLVREHLLPPAEYILESYGTTRTALLPALYLHRIVHGARAWLRPLRSGHR